MKIAVPDLISNSYFPAIAAVELGLYAEQGLEMEHQLIFPVDACFRALRDGEIDFVGGQYNPQHKFGVDRHAAARRKPAQ